MRGGRRELWLVGLMILGPFLLALVALYGPWQLDWLPKLPGSRELVEPPLPVPELASAGAASQWSLIYARTGRCDESCVHALERLRQVHLALGKDSRHVRRLLLSDIDEPAGPETAHSSGPEGSPTAAFEGLERVAFDADLRRALVVLRGERALDEGRIFIADREQRLVASYPSDVEQRELLRDLKRLLDVSGVG